MWDFSIYVNCLIHLNKRLDNNTGIITILVRKRSKVGKYQENIWWNEQYLAHKRTQQRVNNLLSFLGTRGTVLSLWQRRSKVGQVFKPTGTRWWNNHAEAVTCGFSRTFTLLVSSLSSLSLHPLPPSPSTASLVSPSCAATRCSFSGAAELWKEVGGDGINETCSQEPHFTVAWGDVLLGCKLFRFKISQPPSRQHWWEEATCHLWPAHLPRWLHKPTGDWSLGNKHLLPSVKPPQHWCLIVMKGRNNAQLLAHDGWYDYIYWATTRQLHQSVQCDTAAKMLLFWLPSPMVPVEI